jgi:branched-chain amino acid transport system substrate-binding protein
MFGKRIYWIVTAMLLVGLLLGACQPAAEPAGEEAVAPEEAAPEEVVIGVYEPMTGAFAAGGEFTMQGVNLAYKLYPEVLGVPVKLVAVDNRSDKAEAATAMSRLIEQEGAIAVVGTYGSSPERLPSSRT